jgi:hypothetical protein
MGFYVIQGKLWNNIEQKYRLKLYQIIKGMLWDREIPKVYMTATSVRAPDAVFHPSQ